MDLSSLSGPERLQLMDELYQAGHYEAASRAGLWALKDQDRGGYNLTCCLALSQHHEAALYFLQRAADQEGVDPNLAQSDPDLTGLRQDGRWPAIAQYLKEMGDYWAGQSVLRTRLVLPARPKVVEEVVIGLHGLGGNENFISPDYETYAELLGMAFVGLNGSVALGPTAFRWSEDLQRDQAQIELALQSLDSRLKPKRLILFGFSQGGQLAFELATRLPRTVGALVLSPGFARKTTEMQRPGRQQRFIILAGAGENAETVATARADAERARRNGAEVRLKLYPGVTRHGYPTDFSSQFVNWLHWLASGSSAPQTPAP